MTAITEQEQHMSELRTAPATTAVTTRIPWHRIVMRWLVSFVGFPLGGLAATALVGRVDSLASAMAGGLVTGAVLGTVQAWALGPARPRAGAWVVATSAGLMTGLGLGAWLVDYQTGVGSLALEGAVSGALVGAAQAAAMLRRLGRLAYAWPVALSGIWAVGWVVTIAAGIQIGEQFTVFGASGAVVVTLLTSALPLLLNHRDHTETSAS
jgi:hypothetical protein